MHKCLCVIKGNVLILQAYRNIATDADMRLLLGQLIFCCFPEYCGSVDPQDFRDFFPGPLFPERFLEEIALGLLYSLFQAGPGLRLAKVAHVDEIGKAVQGNFVARGHYDKPFHEVLEFPDISGPGIVDKLVQHRGRKRLLVTEMPVVLIDEMPDQQGDVLPALAQGGDSDRHHHEPVIEVFPESAVL